LLGRAWGKTLGEIGGSIEEDLLTLNRIEEIMGESPGGKSKFFYRVLFGKKETTGGGDGRKDN